MRVVLTDDMSVVGAPYQLVPKGTVLEATPWRQDTFWLKVDTGPYEGLYFSRESVCVRLEKTDEA